jgi:hypothetical protein
MNRAEAYILAKNELNVIESDGYGTASQHIETIIQKSVSAPSGSDYDVELSYLWENSNNDKILVICRVSSRNWFQHEQLEETITLCSRAV